jgi:hypothetical protein
MQVRDFGWRRTLRTEDYQATISKMVSLNLPGGGIYDGLIARAALKAVRYRRVRRYRKSPN